MLDDSTGAPLEGATIRIVGTNRGAVTDSNGVFRIDSLPRGVLVVRTLRIGYVQRADTLPFDPLRGARVAIRVRQFHLDLGALCSCPVGPGTVDLNVRVLDATTGLPVLYPSMFVVARATSRISRVPGASDFQWSGRISLPADAVSYRLLVTARGYRETELSPIEAKPGRREVFVLLRRR